MPEEHFGLIPSPPDDRDYPLSSSPAMLEIKRRPTELPILFDLPVTNQGSNPSCAGHAGGTVKQLIELKEKSFIRPDREWLYAECKKIDGIPHVRGTYFRAVLKILRDKGCKLEGQNNDPSIYRIGEYRRVDDLSFEGIKNALAIWGHILGGYTGSRQGWAGEILRPPRAGDTMFSHAIALLGYEENYILGQNSWGEARHNKGIFKAPSGYSPFEGWVITVDRTNDPRDSVQYGWVARFDWKRRIGYVDSNNIVLVTKLNVRSGPGLSNSVIKTLDKGERVIPSETDGTILQDKIADGYTWRSIIIN
jgi:hypothetical protein